MELLVTLVALLVAPLVVVSLLVVALVVPLFEAVVVSLLLALSGAVASAMIKWSLPTLLKAPHLITTAAIPWYLVLRETMLNNQTSPLRHLLDGVKLVTKGGSINGMIADRVRLFLRRSTQLILCQIKARIGIVFDTGTATPFSPKSDR